MTVGWDESIRQPSLAVSSQVRGGGQLRSEVFPFLLGSPSSVGDLGAFGWCRGEEWRIYTGRQGAGSRSQSRSGRLRREGWSCPLHGAGFTRSRAWAREHHVAPQHRPCPACG